MSEGLDLYYWDACIFYEWLKDEPVDRLMKQQVQHILRENKEKRNKICTSVIMHLEVLPKKVGRDEEIKYMGNFSSLHFFDIELDRNILSLAREIKDYYYEEKTETETYKIMSTGDSIQLATAIIHDATEFHTRDNKKKGGNVPLLTLCQTSPNGKICGKYSLKIVSPIAYQGDLLDS
ncbi:type II toxin-antitoxin system VapC family toxin [Asticcacaulis sp.]|uniref:type II toxin-antitoxin system VapC family toxin n=1 Tax=Asticcacaulis sp. TaxID=1872648 RepID=UPI002CEC5A9E|nr:hypothetical protein [Asticcacaulis sp.]HTM79777.1 hypothetical protein [Asticcacaulis sp.]